MKTLLKLAVVALVANGLWQSFGVYAPHLRFKDGVEYAAKYRGTLSNDDLRDKVLSIASQYEIPLTEADVSVTTPQLKHTIIDLSYIRSVNLLPGFPYRWPFSLHVDTFTVPLPANEDLRPK